MTKNKTTCILKISACLFYLILDISMYHITQNLGNVTTLFISVK